MNTALLLALAWLLSFPIAVSAQTQASPASRPAARSAAATSSSNPALIDVNSASEATLDTLPGVGAARAKAIVANRPYTDKEDLVAKKAIPANVLAAIQDRIALVNVNTASAADMARVLPNVGPVRAAQIVANRPYATPQDLVTKGALTQSILAGIRNLVTTGS